MGKRGALLAAELPFRKYIPEFSALPFGAIIGNVWLTDILRIDHLGISQEQVNRLTMEERAFGDYGAGRYAWMLEDPVLFQQVIPIRGSLNLWEYEGSLPDMG